MHLFCGVVAHMVCCVPGTIDPDKMGSGIQYGDLALRTHRILPNEERTGQGCCTS